MDVPFVFGHITTVQHMTEHALFPTCMHSAQYDGDEQIPAPSVVVSQSHCVHHPTWSVSDHRVESLQETLRRLFPSTATILRSAASKRVTALLKQCPDLVRFSGPHESDVLCALAEHCPLLETLDIFFERGGRWARCFWPDQVENEMAKTFASCSKLSQLSLYRAPSDVAYDVVLESMVQNCDPLKIKVVRLDGSYGQGLSKITNAGVAMLARACPNLKEFELGNALYVFPSISLECALAESRLGYDGGCSVTTSLHTCLAQFNAMNAICRCKLDPSCVQLTHLSHSPTFPLTCPIHLPVCTPTHPPIHMCTHSLFRLSAHRPCASVQLRVRRGHARSCKALQIAAVCGNDVRRHG